MKNKILKIERTVKNNLSNCQFSVGMLADELEISVSHLRDTVHQIYHMCPSRFIEIKRLEQAILLLEKDYTIQTIAVKLGYLNPRTFRRIFKKWMDISPQKCKELLLNNNGNGSLSANDVISILWNKIRLE